MNISCNKNDDVAGFHLSIQFVIAGGQYSFEHICLECMQMLSGWKLCHEVIEVPFMDIEVWECIYDGADETIFAKMIIFSRCKNRSYSRV